MDEINAPTGELKTNRLEEAQKTFFFERHNGTTFATQEREAWQIVNRRTKVLGPQFPPPKLIGVSDGTLFRQAVEDAHALHRQGKTLEAMERMREGEAQELEAAKGHIEMPRDLDTVDKQGRPINLASLR